MHKEYYSAGPPLARHFHHELFQRPGFDTAQYSEDIIAAVTKPVEDSSISYLQDSSCEISPPVEELPSLVGNCQSSEGESPGRHAELSIDPLKIYGSPWQPEFYNWAFNLPIGPKLQEKWQAIPTEVDILITHGPPKGIRDKAPSGYDCGCPLLREEIMNRIKPRLHVFGHIHDGYGKSLSFPDTIHMLI